MFFNLKLNYLGQRIGINLDRLIDIKKAIF